MEIIERKENILLDRVEIHFSWRHEGRSTPSRDELLAMVKTLEPSSDKGNIIVKDVNTRFGQPTTTGVAHVYGNKDSMSVEPKYILERHGMLSKTSADVPAAAVAVAATDDGGEE